MDPGSAAKRPASVASIDEENPKRQKKSVADDLLCPITLELPFDPVAAEDGRVYERQAIETHFRSNGSGEQAKSPFTNEMIGTRLFAAPCTKNTIETLIEAGVITGDLADKWNAKAVEQKKVEAILKKAEQGDLTSMAKAGDFFNRGTNGFKQDSKKAFQWFEKAHKAGSTFGTAMMGRNLLTGMGVTKNQSTGLVFSALAAERGSAIGAYNMGLTFADGKYGTTKNNEEAKYWLEKSLVSTGVDHIFESTKKEAQEKLEEVKTRLS